MVAGTGWTRRGAIGLAAGAALASRVRPSRAQALTEITISLSSNSFSTVALRFAERRGFFAQQGLQAKLVTMDNANAAFSAMVGGSVQVASAGAGEALSALVRGLETLAVANIYRGLSSMIVLSKAVADASRVKPDAPLDDRLKVLDGVIFASPSPTAVFGRSIELAVRATGKQPKMTYMGQGAMAAALESGAIQGFVAGTPYWVPPVTRGVGVVWIKPAAGELPERFTPTSSGTLMVTKAYARANPKVVAGLKAVIEAVGRFVAQDREGALQDLAAVYPTLDRETLSLGFDNEWRNWTRSPVTADDIAHDIAFLKAAEQSFPGLDTIDPKALVTL